MKVGTLGWVIAAIALLILAVQLFAHRGDPAKIDQLETDLAALAKKDTASAAQIEIYRAVIAEADSAFARDSVAGQAVVDAATREARSAAASLRDHLANQPGAALLDTLLAKHAAELQAVRDRAARQDRLRLAQIAARDSLSASQDIRIDGLLAQIGNLTEQRDIWKAEARPSFTLRLWRNFKKGVVVSGCAGGGALIWTDSPEYGAMAAAAACSMAF